MKQTQVLIDDEELTYRSKRCSAMDDSEIAAASQLFSENYGYWSANHPVADKAQKRIAYSANRIRSSFVNQPDRYVVMVYHNDDLVGHAFYLRRRVESLGYITWILQLVVKESYRGMHIGTKLMHSIWQLSDNFAWGLFTSNPLTIRALENATMRPVKIGLINKHIDRIRSVAYDLLPNTTWIDQYTGGIVNTDFWTDHSDLQDKISVYETSRSFPLTKKLPEGYEWLAFTFKSQKQSLATPEQLATYFAFSESVLFKAYSQMDMQAQGWTRYTEQEVEQICKDLPSNCDILDLGCGYGRHSEELARRGHRVVAVDYAHVTQTDIEIEPLANPVYVRADARCFDYDKQFDAVLCMYDVIGSFPSNQDNLHILDVAYRLLKPGGKLFLSVMSLQTTIHNCKKHRNVVSSERDAYTRIMNLSGSDTMQRTGEIFDGNHVVVNQATGVCYRKEQFFLPDYLPTEILIRDRRYTTESISPLLRKAGFSIVKHFGFRAGKFSAELKEENSKELFILAHKVSPLAALLQRLTTKVID